MAYEGDEHENTSTEGWELFSNPSLQMSKTGFSDVKGAPGTRNKVSWQDAVHLGLFRGDREKKKIKAKCH